MKTFSTTEARNRFGEFLDAGMIERVKLVRNNRIIGYFLPERDYVELTRASATEEKRSRHLSKMQEEALTLYSQGQIGASEAKANLECNYRELLAMLAQRNLALPHIDLNRAEKMATEALSLMNIPVLKPANGSGSIQHG
jgi:hypothetical protein